MATSLKLFISVNIDILILCKSTHDILYLLPFNQIFYKNQRLEKIYQLRLSHFLSDITIPYGPHCRGIDSRQIRFSNKNDVDVLLR